MQALREAVAQPVAAPPHPAVNAAPATQSKPTQTADPFADLMQRAAKVDYDKALEPRTLPEAITLAKHMHDSRLFSAYGTPQAVLATIMAGREFGLQAMAALRGFHVIDGKQVMSADLIRAVTQRAPMCEYFRCIERTATAATWVTKRKGDPELSLRFTVEEGRRAWSKDQVSFDKSGWGKNPADMCIARASAKLARLVYADVVFNMYAPEEME